MRNVIFLKPREKKSSFETPLASGQTPPAPSEMKVSFSEAANKHSLFKINELEAEIMSLLEVNGLENPFHRTIAHPSNTAQEEEGELPDLSTLNEIVVFSPEIQQQGFAELSSGEGEAVPASWGDVFVKIGDEYPFLFTAYTKGYARSQRLRYGEEISPSLRDILLDRKQLDCGDIIRAVIKWVNLYCPSLKGRPISLEADSVLQTLVCDPLVEIHCPDSAL